MRRIPSCVSLTLLVAVGFHTSLVAQAPVDLYTARECTPALPHDSTGTTVRMGDRPPRIDRPVLREPSPEPALPRALDPTRSQRSVLNFVVDVSGHIDLCTAHVIAHSDSAWTAAVALILPRLLYLPGRVGGKPARMLVQQAFTYSGTTH